ncbi:MAG: hypothetical protein ACFFBD_11155 [Candidatus Hodarchaeota archaeon]
MKKPNLLKYVEGEQRKGRSLEEIAKDFNMTVKQLKRWIARKKGIRLDYIEKERLRRRYS